MSTEDTILVGGGTGMPGEQVARQLHRDGFEVRVLARDVERARTLLGPDFEYLAGDVDDRDAVESALEGCAGVHVSLRGASDPDELDRVEHQGTARGRACRTARSIPVDLPLGDAGRRRCQDPRGPRQIPR
jgi:uncharacterized protein YbjT (DUF2867 family)